MAQVVAFLSSAWVPWLILCAVFGTGVTIGLFRNKNATKADVSTALTACQALHKEDTEQILSERENIWGVIRTIDKRTGDTAIVVSRIEGYLQQNGYQRG